MIAWGGSLARTWFYDLSAGPESWTSNWGVDDDDVDGDGWRLPMPPIWEYAANGNRTRSALGSDLGKVVRYVAINLLFTSSPLYDPMNTAPDPGGAKKVVYTMFEADPASQGTDFLDLSSSKAEWQDLEPYVRWKTSLTDVDPINPGSQRTLDIFAGLNEPRAARAQYGDSFAQPFCYYDARRGKYLPPSGKDYVEGVYGFNTTEMPSASRPGCSATPTTTGSTARSRTSSSSTRRTSGTSATGSRRRPPTKWATTSGCRTRTTATTPTRVSTTTRSATSTTPGQVTRATRS